MVSYCTFQIIDEYWKPILIVLSHAMTKVITNSGHDLRGGCNVFVICVFHNS